MERYVSNKAADRVMRGVVNVRIYEALILLERACYETLSFLANVAMSARGMEP